MRIILTEQEVKQAVREFIQTHQQIPVALTGILIKVVSPDPAKVARFDCVEIEAGDLAGCGDSFDRIVKRTPKESSND